MTNPDTAIVEGVDVDALAAAVRSCPAVDDLDGGPLGTVATYLPGRRVPGIRIGADRASIQVRGKWDVPSTRARWAGTGGGGAAHRGPHDRHPRGRRGRARPAGADTTGPGRTLPAARRRSAGNCRVATR